MPRAAKSASAKRKKQREEPAPAKPLMACYPKEGRYYWRNRHGRMVFLDDISDWGIRVIIKRLDDEGPRSYLEIFEREARRRGMMDVEGRFVREEAQEKGAGEEVCS